MPKSFRCGRLNPLGSDPESPEYADWSPMNLEPLPGHQRLHDLSKIVLDVLVVDTFSAVIADTTFGQRDEDIQTGWGRLEPPGVQQAVGVKRYVQCHRAARARQRRCSRLLPSQPRLPSRCSAPYPNLLR